MRTLVRIEFDLAKHLGLGLADIAGTDFLEIEGIYNLLAKDLEERRRRWRSWK